jgi:hypothetical protein
LFFWIFAGERADPSGLTNLAPISNCLFTIRGAAMQAGQGAVLAAGAAEVCLSQKCIAKHVQDKIRLVNKR